MLIGCLSVYQEEALLRGALESIYRVVDHIIVVDGAYTDYPHLIPRSTDATLDIAHEYGLVIGCGARAWPSQIEKRNQYLKHCHPGDWVLMIDADERLRGKLNFPRVKEGTRAYRLQIFTDGWPKPTHAIRLFRVEEGTEYRGAHDVLCYEGKPLIENEMPLLEGCSIEHLSYLRNVDRITAKMSYYERQQIAEKDFRTRHNIP